MAFYTALGFNNNPQFSDETAACMVLSEAIHVVLLTHNMLLTHNKWRFFTSRPIPPTTSSEVMLCVSCESREAVEAMNHAAGLHGGTADIHAVQDHGFIYNRSFTDPDGQIWEPMWMDASAVPS
jgi:uncharacterized protein